MSPPETQGQGIVAEAPAGSPAVSLCVLQKRADFLKLTPAQLDTVSSSMKRLEPRLGRITIPKFVKKKCQEVTIWATTGQQVVEVDGQSVIVKVQAGKTAQAGSCAGATK